MARYIDADALAEQMLNRYKALVNEYGDYDHYTTGYDDAIDEIESFPAADVAPNREVAREIFAEIKKAIREEALDYCNGFEKTETRELQEYYKIKQDTAIFLFMKIDHLEKKYTEGEK